MPSSRRRFAPDIPTNFPKSSPSRWRQVCPSTSIGWPPKPSLHEPFPCPSSGAPAATATGRGAYPQDLLEPDKAFRFSVRALDASALEVRYRIAEGYYLYRDKFSFSAEPAEVKLGRAEFPK